MINTTAPLFKNDTFEVTIKRQQAELYSRMFGLMSEDFVTNTDIQNYLKLLSKCLSGIQEQLDSLFNIVANHTHNVPPHTHPLPPHTHYSASPGSLTSNNIGAYSTLGTPLVTRIPTESGSIKWNTIGIPEIVNTTGAIQNLQGSRIITGPSLEGPLVTSTRRMKTPEILNTTKTIPPILKGPFSL